MVTEWKIFVSLDMARKRCCSRKAQQICAGVTVGLGVLVLIAGLAIYFTMDKIIELAVDQVNFFGISTLTDQRQLSFNLSKCLFYLIPGQPQFGWIRNLMFRWHFGFSILPISRNF